MFLSRIWVDPSRRGAKRLLASPQRVHAVIAAATSTREGGPRPLWRLDQSASGLQLLVTSGREADFTSLLEQLDMPREDGWETTPYQPFLDRISGGQRWKFALACNPVRSVREVEDPTMLTRGKRVPVVGAHQLQDWLIKRAPTHGFHVDDNSFIVSGRRAEDFHRKGSADSGGTANRVRITAVRYSGTLRVDDADRLRTALTEGVGSAKAYGCGLLTLAPVA